MTTRVQQAASKRKGHKWFAALFDPLNRITGTETKFLAKYRPHVAGEATGHVLEVGAGTGANLAFFAKADTVIVTEPDPYMLERARKRLAELGGKNIELAQHAAEELPFPDATFDSVVSTMVFCSVADPNRALAEVSRVLKASGSFRFVEHVRPEKGVKARVFDAITPIWRWFGAGCHPNRRTLESIKEAGFEVAELKLETHSGMPVIIGVAVPRNSANRGANA
ncbi:MAG: class I SAM-dependent methyltransferase [Thermoanaerobaculia bacterium]